MSGDAAFAIPGGHAAALVRHGEVLGQTAAGLATQVDQVRRGAGLVQLALLRSSSALRIDELRRGIRGVDHEVAVLRAAGEQVADVVRERAAALRRLTDEMEQLEQQARAQPDRRPLLELQADAARADHRRADQRAGEAIEQVTSRLAAGPTLPASADPWLQVDGAYESIADAAFRAEQGTVWYQFAGFADGVGHGATGSLHNLKELVGHPGDTASGMLHLVTSLATHPVGTSRSMWEQLVHPYATDWSQREYGRAVGRGSEALLEVVVGAKGATRAGALGKEAVVIRATDPLRPAIIRVGDLKLPGVPNGARGIVTKSGKGWIYPIPVGTQELHTRVTAVRIMSPTHDGPYPYPGGYANYLNEQGQVVNPLTGQTLTSKKDPLWHIHLVP